MIERDVLAKELVEFLPRQRWFGAKDRDLEHVEVTHLEELRAPWPALVHALVEVDLGGVVQRYQVPLGLRPAGPWPEFLHGAEHAVVGELGTAEGPALVYDALLDPELSLALVGIVVPDEHVERVRVMSVEQTNSSLVFDDRLIMKIFRRLGEGPNLDVEVTRALADVGFPYVASPVAVWRQDDHDLAFVQRFLSGGVDGWALSLTSLRDLYAEEAHPAQAGGDFSAEARRLGIMTAELHLDLAAALGSWPADVDAWADRMEEQLARATHPMLAAPELRAPIERLRGVREPGVSIRVHGDYHLGQAMRTDEGWFVLDFEGEPTRPPEERRMPSSPFKDVAGMLRSFDYASKIALAERAEPERHEALAMLAAAWEGRNRRSFLDGYNAGAAKGGILPSDPESRQVLLAAFELEKAVYEVAYEQAHRPDWVAIPLAAIERLASGLSEA